MPGAASSIANPFRTSSPPRTTTRSASMTPCLRSCLVAGLLPAVLVACAAPIAPAAKAPATFAAPVPDTAVAVSSDSPTEDVALVNPGFESTLPGRRRGDPEGWFSFQHAGAKSYLFVVDAALPHSGERSLRIENVGPEPYGAVAQYLKGAPHAGKVARLTGWLRTRDAADAGAVLTLLALKGGVPLAQNFMPDAPVKGTTDWTRYTITLPIAHGADRIEVGAMLQGRGSLWLDDVTLEFVPP